MSSASLFWDLLHEAAPHVPSELFKRISDALDDGADIVLPRELTAANGAKAALIGEFFQETEISVECPDEGDDCEEYDCDGTHHTITHKVPVTWSTIKSIWKAAVDHFEQAATLSESKDRGTE